MVKKFNYFIRCIKLYIKYFISLLFRIIRVKQNKIVVCSYVGNDYGDGPKYIVDSILNSSKVGEYDIVWAVRDEFLNKNSLPKGVRPVKYKTLKYLFELTTAKIWIDNARKSFVPLKRKGQYYFQLWHGPICLKKVELDASDTLPKMYIKYLKIDNKNADYFISGSKWTTNLFRKSFGYKGYILEQGNPRNDIFFNKEKHEEIKQKVYKYFGLPSDINIILYAPTFRDSKTFNPYIWDYQLIINEFEKKYSKKYCMLYRFHPNVGNLSKKLENHNNIILNATFYPDMQELMIASEILITDYSSTMFEFGMINKKCFLYAPDISEYLKERKMYFDIKKLPFKLSENIQEFRNTIMNFDDIKYKENLSTFFKTIGLMETGSSSQIIANLIKEKCNEKK